MVGSGGRGARRAVGGGALRHAGVQRTQASLFQRRGQLCGREDVSVGISRGKAVALGGCRGNATWERAGAIVGQRAVGVAVDGGAEGTLAGHEEAGSPHRAGGALLLQSLLQPPLEVTEKDPVNINKRPFFRRERYKHTSCPL